MRNTTSDLAFKSSVYFIGNDAVTAQKNIAKDLIDNFPNIEFLLIEQGGVVLVEWEDAATCQEVSKIIDKYNLLEYKSGSDILVRKANTSFNGNQGGCFLRLHRYANSLSEQGHNICCVQIMESAKNYNNNYN